MVKKYRMEYERNVCIGAASCTIPAPDYFVMAKDGRANLIGGKEREKDVWILDFEEKDFEKIMQAAKLCPVNAIHIIDLEKNEKII